MLVDHSGMMFTKVWLVQEDNYVVLCIWISYEQLEICTMQRKPYTSKEWNNNSVSIVAIVLGKESIALVNVFSFMNSRKKA